MRTKRKPKVPPPTRFPNLAAKTYERAMIELINEMHAATLDAFRTIIRPATQQYQSNLRTDGPLDVILQALSWLKLRSSAVTFTSGRLSQVAQNFVSSVSTFNKRNVDDQIRRVKGIDPTQAEPWLASFMRTSVSENVSLIKSVETDYHKIVESIVFKGTKEGRSIREMTEAIQSVSGVSYNRAKFIAVDQTGSLLGQLTKTRHEAAGIRRFEWSTSGDARVRATHRARNGKVYDYATATVIPGSEYRCRCVARPVFEEDE